MGQGCPDIHAFGLLLMLLDMLITLGEGDKALKFRNYAMGEYYESFYEYEFKWELYFNLHLKIHLCIILLQPPTTNSLLLDPDIMLVVGGW